MQILTGAEIVVECLKEQGEIIILKGGKDDIIA